MHSFIKKICDEDKVPPVVLFSGPKGSGKRACALELAIYLMGESHRKKIEQLNHPDLKVLSVEGKSAMHPVENIRRMVEENNYPPYEASCRVFVIDEAERMLPTSSNALLKTFEEPNPHVYFILLSSDPGSILPTIRSRSRAFDFVKESFVPPLHESLLKILSRSCNYSDLLKILAQLEEEFQGGEDPTQKSASMETLFSGILAFYRDLYWLQEGGEPSYLFYPDHLDILKKSLPPPPLPQLLSLLEDCQLALQRSMKLSVVLECFFIKQDICSDLFN